MHENVLPAIGRLNKPEALLVVKPLHSSLVHLGVLSDSVHVEQTRRAIASAPIRFVDFGEGSETCAPVSNEAKRPSRSAKYRLMLHRVELSLLQGSPDGIVNNAHNAIGIGLCILAGGLLQPPQLKTA